MSAVTSPEAPRADGPSPESYGWLRRQFLAHPWAFAVVAAIVFVPAIRPCTRYEPAAPAVMSELPRQWALTDQDGQPLSAETLRGDVWIASFFFTTCPTICRTLMGQVKALHDRFAAQDVDGIRLVSFTVDPEHDTPAVLKAYGAELGADFGRWRFATGPRESLETLVIGGFRTVLGDKTPVGGSEDGLDSSGVTVYDVAHSTKLVLVDGEGRIRGYFGTDEQGLDEVFHRAQHVLRDMRRGDEV